MDELLRRLARLAATGDPEAIQKLQRWQEKLQAPIPKYFCYSQNNIMGIMIDRPSEGIGPYVVMEAFDEDHADDRLQALLGDSYFGYCECCGRRWGNVRDTFENRGELSSWWLNRTNTFRDTRARCYVHLLDGTIASC